MIKILVIKPNLEDLCHMLDKLHMPYKTSEDVTYDEGVEILFIHETLFMKAAEKLEDFLKPIIVVSNLMDGAKLNELYELGADDFVVEPIHERLVQVKLEMWAREERDSHQETIGLYTYDVMSKTLFWDKSMYNIHHLSHSIETLDEWRNLICDEDKYLFDYVYEQATLKAPYFDVTYKLKSFDAVIKVSGFILLNENGLSKVMGTCQLGENNYGALNKETSFETLIQKKKKKKDYLESSLNIANVGYWEWHIAEDYSYENDQWFSMLGYDRKTFKFNDDFFYGLMHPNDLNRMVKALDDIAAGKKENIDEEFRLRHADGTWIWIMDKGKVLKFSEDGKAMLASGVHVDITEQKRTMHEKELLSHAVEHSPISIVITDNVGEIEYINPAYEEMTGYTQEEMIGKKASMTTSGYHPKEFYDDLWSELYKGNQWRGNFYNVRKDGSFYWESAVITPLFDSNEQIISFIALKQDISVQKIKEQAILDRNKRLTRQQWILQSLTQNKDLNLMALEDAFHVINESVVNGLDIDACAICMFQDMNTNLKVVNRFSQYKEKPKHAVYLLDETRMTFNTLIDGGTISINDSYDSEFEDMQKFLRDEGTLSSIHIPIYFEQEVVGCIRGESKANARLWPEDEISFLKAIGNFLNIILETRERLKAQQRAEAAAAAKSTFLANMSHEIRTPMNAVIGLSQRALQSEITPREEWYLQKINNAANHLLVLINDILDYSKVEAGKMTIEHKPFNLKALMEQVEDIVTEKAAQKRLPFIIELSDELPIHLVGDSFRLRQILLNLVSNAIKFTEEGYVQLTVERVYSDANNDNYIMLQFSVKDTGIGLSDDSINKLFESFQQADTSISREYGGTGLGLSISKELAKLFGGTIDVSSELGVGSTFSFTANFEVGNDHYENNESLKIVLMPEDLQSKIVVVEHDEINQEIITGYLQELGLKPVILTTGQSLIDYLDSGEPCGLILLEMKLPDLSGFDIAYIIRSNSMYQHIPMVAISSDARPENRFKTINHGINEYLLKPFDKEEFKDVVVKWLRQKPMTLKIENVDTDLGLKRFKYNESLYLKILRQFTVEHIDDVELVRKAIQEKNGEEKKVLRTLRGVAGHIGSLYLEQEVRALEDSVMNRKRGYKDKLDQLEQTMREMKDNIQEALKSYHDADSDEKTIDMKETKAQLKALSKPLTNGNINEIKSIMRVLKHHCMHDKAEVVFDKMSLKIKRYQYDEAEKTLKTLLDLLEEENEHNLNC